MKALGQSGNQKSRVALGTNRKRKIGTSPPTTVELRGLSIHFPFEPYQCQIEYMNRVLDALLRSENALLESPTGTGKTLCLLCATLAWQRNQAKIIADSNNLQLSQQQEKAPTENNSILNASKPASKRVPTIIYASRTHSQISQVVRELANTRYRPKHAILGSREQMCVHPKVKKPAATSADINHDCNALAKERKCRFRNGLDGFVAPNPEDHMTQAVLDMEDLVKMGKDHKVCPFYYTRSLLPDAELILMPYNYLFDKDSRETTLKEIDWRDAVVIFDEAHNLEAFATESASFDLTSTDIAICMSELNRAINYVQMSGDEGFPVCLDHLVRMKALFIRFEDYINDLDRSGAFSGEMMMEIFTKGMSINHGNHHLFIDECRKVNEMLLDARGGSSSSHGAPKLEHFVQCLKRVFGEPTEGRCLAKAKSYRVHITPKNSAESQQVHNNQKGPGTGGSRNNSNAARTISYWCFAPALAMQELFSLKIRSILVTSGTLSPLPSYSMELGIPFPHTLENPHIISKEQIHVRVIGKGVSGKKLTSSFQRRKDVDYYIELGNTLVTLAKIIPGGMLVFFPSYGVMETCLERWGGPVSSASRYNDVQKAHKFFAARKAKGKQSSQQFSFPYTAPSIYGTAFSGSGSNNGTPWKRLLGAKSVVLEPKSSGDLPDAISEFHKYLNMPKSKGCVLMGVCRGKISEGIDFANNMSRAVVITGLPFPPAFDPKVKLKREYLDSVRASSNIKSKEEGGFGDTIAAHTSHETSTVTQSLSGHEWYSQQAHRAVNQAIGRVIRNRNDYGAVLLLDSRYAEPVNHQGLSKWLRPYLQQDEGMGTVVASLSKFYKEAEAKAREIEEQNKGIVLEYEDEEEQAHSRLNKQQKQEENENEGFTKVAFIRNIARAVDQEKANERFNNGTCNSEGMNSRQNEAEAHSSSYIAPERVIARLDVKEFANQTEPVFINSTKAEQVTRQQPPKYDSVFSASKSQLPLYCKVRSMNSGDVKGVRSIDSKKVALQFFNKARTMLSPGEFSSLKAALVAMKQHGAKDEQKAYLKSAREILTMCSANEDCFEGKHEQTLMFLFFQLVPPKLRPSVEKIAMKGLFKQSTLAQLCKENLNPESQSKLVTVFTHFLWSLWCKGEGEPSGDLVSDKKQYLREVQKILLILQENETSVSSSIVDALVKFIPSKLVGATRALVEENRANHNVKRIKATEATRRNDETLEDVRFQKVTCSDERTNQTNTVRPEFCEESGPRKNEPKIQQGKSLETAKPNPLSTRTVNPYSSKFKSLSSLIHNNGTISSHTGTATTKASASSAASTSILGNKNNDTKMPPAYSKQSQLALLGKPSSQKKSASENVPGDAVSKMLQEAESQPFEKKSARDIIKTLESNVPSDYYCIICNENVKTPMLGECRHMACHGCWVHWLQKSKTCPVCRAAINEVSLARVVFRDNQELGSLKKDGT